MATYEAPKLQPAFGNWAAQQMFQKSMVSIADQPFFRPAAPVRLKHALRTE